MNTCQQPDFTDTAHDPLPRRGSVKREEDGTPPSIQIKPGDYPLLAACAGCEFSIRNERTRWEHIEPEGSAADLSSAAKVAVSLAAMAVLLTVFTIIRARRVRAGTALPQPAATP